MTINQRLFLIIISLLVFLYSAHWFFAQDMFFTQDEIILNYWSNIVGFPHFRIFKHKHDDRPVGWFFIALCQMIFDVNYRAQIGALFALHLANAALLFVFIRNYCKSHFNALCGGIFFACYFPSNSSAYYIGAIFDVACCTFILFSLLCFQYRKKHVIYGGLSIIFYFVSLRAKEMPILLPVILTMLIVTESTGKTIREHFLTALKSTWVHYLVIVTFVIALFYYGLIGSSVPEADAYYMDLSFVQFSKNLTHYLCRIIPSNTISLPYVVIGFSLLLAIVMKRKRMFFAVTGFILMLQPVLFYKQHSSDLYLYIPNIFFAMIVVEILDMCLSLLGSQEKPILKKWLEFILVSLVIVVSFLSINSKPFLSYVQNEQEIRQPLGRLSQYIKNNIKKVEPNTKIYIAGIPRVEVNQNAEGWKTVSKLLGFTLDDRTVQAYTDNMYPNLMEVYLSDIGPKIFLRYENGFYSQIQSN